MQQVSVPVPAPLGVIHQEKDLEGTFIGDVATIYLGGYSMRRII